MRTFVTICCIATIHIVSVYVSLDYFFFFKQKTAYEMRISDWSSDVCSSDLQGLPERGREVRVTDKSQQSRQEPVVDVLRENPRSDRAADVQPGGRPADRKSVV